MDNSQSPPLMFSRHHSNTNYPDTMLLARVLTIFRLSEPSKDYANPEVDSQLPPSPTGYSVAHSDTHDEEFDDDEEEGDGTIHLKKPAESDLCTTPRKNQKAMVRLTPYAVLVSFASDIATTMHEGDLVKHLYNVSVEEINEYSRYLSMLKSSPNKKRRRHRRKGHAIGTKSGDSAKLFSRLWGNERIKQKFESANPVMYIKSVER